MKILLCDDHPMFRLALRSVLTRQFPTLELIETYCAKRVLESVQEHTDLRLVLLDHHLPDGNGISLLEYIKECCSAKLIIVSARESTQLIRKAIASGANGFIPKSTPIELLEKAISLVLAGGTYVPAKALIAESSRLTPRQREIVDLLAKGMTNSEICGALDISENTVKTHLRQIFKILDVSNRTEATLVWLEDFGR